MGLFIQTNNEQVSQNQSWKIFNNLKKRFALKELKTMACSVLVEMRTHVSVHATNSFAGYKGIGTVLLLSMRKLDGTNILTDQNSRITTS